MDGSNDDLLDGSEDDLWDGSEDDLWDSSKDDSWDGSNDDPWDGPTKIFGMVPMILVQEIRIVNSCNCKKKKIFFNKKEYLHHNRHLLQNSHNFERHQENSQTLHKEYHRNLKKLASTYS